VRLGHTIAATSSTNFAAGTTLVYSGNVTTTLGENKLVFNQSLITWDGVV
jgi:hypothetical protein